MRLDVLGPMSVRDADRSIDPGPRRHREVLAALAIAAPDPVATDLLIEQVWGRPDVSPTSVQAIISRLRSRLGDGVLRTEASGYRLDSAVVELDADQFEAGLRDARAATTAVDGLAVLRGALDLWRGPAYAGVELAVAEAEADRLTQLRLQAWDLLAQLELELGRSEHVADWLAPLVAEHPLRETLRASLMLAQYRSGRQVDAVATYDAGRSTLADELGLDPSPQLQALYQRILRQDQTLIAAPAVDAAPANAMIGREAELATLRAAMRQAAAGTPRVVVVTGEAGIGKTCLVEAAVSDPGGALVVWARSWDHEGAPALWPWEQLLTGLAGQVDDVEMSQALDGRGAAAGLLLPGHDEAPQRQANESPAAARTRLFDAVATVVARLSRGRAVVLVLEDLHWADRESIELTEFVAASATGSRLALIVTVRDPADGVSHTSGQVRAALARVQGSQLVALEGLSVPEVRRLVEARATGPVTDEAAIALRARTEGNPFYLSELAMLLGDERRSAGRADVAVPAGVRAVIERRLQHLTDPDRDLLMSAAMIGRTFDVGLLTTLLQRPRYDVLEAIERVARTGLLVAQPPGSEQRFSHALVQETLTLLPGALWRATTHAAIAAAIEERAGEPEQRAAALAHHYAEAGELGDPARGIVWSLDSAGHAERRLALEEAERLLRRAFALLDTEAGRAEPELELQVRVRLGSLLTMRLGYNDVEVARQRERALELAEQLGHIDQLLSALWGTWGTALVSGDFDTALVVCARMDDAVERTQDPFLRLASCAARGQTQWHLGRLAQACDDLRHAIDLADTHEEDLPLGLFLQHPGIQARGWLSIALAMAGETNESDAVADDIARRLVPMAHPFTEAYSTVLEGLRRMWLGRPDGARQITDRGLAIAEQHGFDQIAAFALIPSGAAAGLLGDTATGEARLQAAINAFSSLPNGFMFGHLMFGLLADVQARAGRDRDAAASLQRAFAEAERTQECFHLPELHRLGADLAARAGRDPRPQRQLARATATAQGARLFLQRTG